MGYMFVKFTLAIGFFELDRIVRVASDTTPSPIAAVVSERYPSNPECLLIFDIHVYNSM
jgi:hypothetical protein